MIAVIQLVDHASVKIVGQESKNEINKGLMILLGVSRNDTQADVEKLANKIVKLRIFPDDNKQMNLDIKSVNGEILLISQFTLLANTKSGNRPDFINAADKPLAITLYKHMSDRLVELGVPVKTGFFGEHMSISADLNGPVTINLDSDKL